MFVVAVCLLNIQATIVRVLYCWLLNVPGMRGGCILLLISVLETEVLTISVSLTSHVIGNAYSCTRVAKHTSPRFLEVKELRIFMIRETDRQRRHSPPQPILI